MRRVFVGAAFRINFSKATWTVWLGWVLTVVATIVTASLSMTAFKAEAASATSEVNVRKLAAAKQIDRAARAKYQTDQAAKKVAAGETARLVTEMQIAQARTASTTRLAAKQPATSKPTLTTPTCDRLIIPKIGLNACLATVGLASDGAVDVHASLPAWFNQSSPVGTNTGHYSATFIDGHRSGIFRNLGRLAVGDTITVALMGGESYTYTVRISETTPLNRVDMRKALSIYGDAGLGLNLMTCDGAYNSNLGTAEARLTVYATR